MIRKTSLLRIVPTACGQAADIARKPARNGANLHRRPVWNGFCARRLRIDRDLHRERILGAILPLHDIRYHAHAFSLAACWRLRNDFSANEPGSPADFPARVPRLVEPDGIEPTTSCLQSRRSPN